MDLFADDPLVFKKLIYEMRFDEVSAVYALFGQFYLGVRVPAAGLGQAAERSTCRKRLTAKVAEKAAKSAKKSPFAIFAVFFATFAVIFWSIPEKKWQPLV